MIEIRNKTKEPVQIIVRSKKSPRSFTTMYVPSIGKNNNVISIEDELHTEYIDRVEKMGFISVKRINK